MSSEYLRPDIRDTPLYREARDLLSHLRGLSTPQLSDAAELDVSCDQRHAVFSGTTLHTLEGAPATSLWLIELQTGELRCLTATAAKEFSDRSPKFSPDGSRVAFLSDRGRPGDFQLYLLNLSDASISSTPAVAGWVEYLHWSADGERILLGIAGHGADTAGAQGALTSLTNELERAAWIPTVDAGDDAHLWRSAWVYESRTGHVRQINRAGCNVWEAVWCGAGALAAIVSPRPDESAWYTATLVHIELESGAASTLYTSRDQLGGLAAAPSGAHLVFVEAVCSDRGLVAGDLHLVSLEDGAVRRIETHGVDIGSTQWRSNERLLLAGQRAFASVLLLYDLKTDEVREQWASEMLTTGGRGRYFTVGGRGTSGDAVLVGEGFSRAPEIALIQEQRYREVRSLDLGYARHIAARAHFETVRWNAPDGLEIHGWLMRPTRPGPHPLVMEIHGGPVWHWRSRWLVREGLHALLLLEHGYAVFWPNPRGSSARGQDFARRVQGDLCGADTFDLLSGVDHLVRKGIADPARLGVMGRSYGGCMTAWLITQDSRFAAAAPLAPHTNQISQHLTSNIPQFDTLFLRGRYNDPAGLHFSRSAVMYAHQVRTPTLNLCGALDRCTPPGQALEFHNALREHGVESALVTYPQEGHGNRQWPAVIDYAARIVAWFERHMPSR